MNWRAAYLALIVTFTVSACATTKPGPTDADVAALSSPLILGVAQIRDKALDPPDVDKMFTAALANLSTLDQRLHFDVSDDAITVKFGDAVLVHTSHPQHQDIGAWVQDTEALIRAARRVSLPFATASSDVLLQTLYSGIIALLDPYSRYAGPHEAERNRVARNGAVGLGFDLDQAHDGALVRAIQKNSPADKAGIKTGDIIVQVNGRYVIGRPLAAILHRLDGVIDTPVDITVVRNAMPHTVSATRAWIIPETVIAEATNGILHLSIKGFNVQTAEDVSKAIAAAGPLQGIILDLRNDPGGLLDQAVAIADMFLDKGTIATLHGRHPGADQFYAATPGDVAPHVPMAMLLDGLSASASEILAAALRENGRAIAIGTASVGKGTVQTLIELSNNAELSVSWARVTTPNGTLLNERGILPDICTAVTPLGTPPSAGDIIARQIRDYAKNGVSTAPSDVRAARTACRPEPRADQEVDLEVARRWVVDAGVRAALPQPTPEDHH